MVAVAEKEMPNWALPCREWRMQLAFVEEEGKAEVMARQIGGGPCG
jgi:hypothetical protein